MVNIKKYAFISESLGLTSKNYFIKTQLKNLLMLHHLFYSIGFFFKSRNLTRFPLHFSDGNAAYCSTTLHLNWQKCGLNILWKRFLTDCSNIYDNKFATAFPLGCANNRIMPLGYLQRNYYCLDSNMMIIEEKFVLSTYFFSYAKEWSVIWAYSPL